MRADITLFNGTIITHSPEPNGATRASVKDSPRAMTDAEWADYCERLKASME